MKLSYVKPDAEFIDLCIVEEITDAGIYSEGVGEGEPGFDD